MKKLIPLRRLIKKAWIVWSIHIRQSVSNFAGYSECYTCRKKFPWKELQAGHFIHGKLDFDPLNIHPQCVRCNKWLRGNLGKYAIRLIEDHGLRVVNDLQKRANIKGNLYSRKEIQEILDKYS